MNDQNIDTVDFAFQWNTPHTGGYDVAAVEEFMADSLNGVSYKVVVDTEDPVIPEDPGTAEDPAQNPEQPTGNEQNIEKGKPAKPEIPPMWRCRLSALRSQGARQFMQVCA